MLAVFLGSSCFIVKALISFQCAPDTAAYWFWVSDFNYSLEVTGM